MKSLSMDISVKFSEDQCELSLGICKAKLSTTELLLLRENLAEKLQKIWQKPAGFWEAQQTKLDELNYVAVYLAQLDDVALEKILINHTSCNWIALLGFARSAFPELANRLQKIIKKHSNNKNPIFFDSPDDFIDQLHLKPAISITHIIETLEALETALIDTTPALAQMLAEQKPSDPPSLQNNLHSSTSPAANDKAFSFLDHMGSLPVSNLRFILKRISREEIELLFSTCKMLKAAKLLKQLSAIFPEKIFQQLEKNCQAKVEEHEVRGLLNKLNGELKELKTLLDNRRKE